MGIAIVNFLSYVETPPDEDGGWDGDPDDTRFRRLLRSLREKWRIGAI